MCLSRLARRAAAARPDGEGGGGAAASGCSHPVDALSCEQAEEEALLSTSFTLLLDSDGAFRGLHKPGGAPLDEVTAEASSRE